MGEYVLYCIGIILEDFCRLLVLLLVLSSFRSCLQHIYIHRYTGAVLTKEYFRLL